ncbi:MAG: hypothetical protein RBS80_31240 [Thermoguttaceae bacterium]|jgi:hypothetical protein|nr:hypothetical protein [Thermoguttaceae bacterium]
MKRRFSHEPDAATNPAMYDHPIPLGPKRPGLLEEAAVSSGRSASVWSVPAW